MNLYCESPRKNPAFYVALVGCLGLWFMSSDPLAVTNAQREYLARDYKFERTQLPGAPGGFHRTLRPVAPSLKRIEKWCSALSSGVTIADLDGDGLPNDVLYTDNRSEQLLVVPAPGSAPRYKPFELVCLGGDRKTAVTSGCLVGDFNEDGRADILVFYIGRTPQFFIRKATPAGASGLSLADFDRAELFKGADLPAWGTTAGLQADFDGDGHMDIAIGNYFPDWCDVYDPTNQRVQEMHNNNGWASNGGGIHFFLRKPPTAARPLNYEDVPELLPERVLRGWTLAMGAQDLNGDLLPELYIGNDLGPDRLLRNDSTPGHLKFTVVNGESDLTTPGSFVLGHDKYKGMSCDFFDLNADGISDMFVSNVATKFAIQESHFLWMSKKDGPGLAQGRAPYVQDSERLGMSRGGWGWDTKFESFRNQVMPDLLQVNGFIQGKTNRWPEMQSLATYNSAFLKDPRGWPGFVGDAEVSGGDTTAFYTWDGVGKYVNVGRQVGFTVPYSGRGAATADVDGDGRVDLALANMWNPGFYYQNRSSKVGRYLGVRLMLPTGAEQSLKVLDGRPRVDGRPPFGAVATVKLPCGRLVRREVDGGNGHTGRRSPELHFGLGDLKADVQSLPVTVQWRRGDGSLSKPVELSLKCDRWQTVVLGSGNGREVSQ